MSFGEKTISSSTKFEGRVVDLKVDQVELINGKIATREVVEHPGGVAIVPLDENNNVLMVRQFRYPFKKELLEIPVGKFEKGEDPDECAVRELSEETGCSAGKMISLGKMYSSPGFCSEVLHVYLAMDLSYGKMHLDEDEFLNVERVPLSKLIDMIMANELPDAKSVIGILKTKLYLEERYR